MATPCPVCGDESNHVRRERPGDPPSHPDARPGPHATIEVEELCTADKQWDRICHKAAVETDGGMMTPVLEVFYHYYGDDGDDETEE
jgi:hypothetical protein